MNTSAASHGAFSTNSSNESNSQSSTITCGSSLPRLLADRHAAFADRDLGVDAGRVLRSGFGLSAADGSAACLVSAASSMRARSAATAAPISAARTPASSPAASAQARPATSAIPSTSRRDRTGAAQQSVGERHVGSLAKRYPAVGCGAGPFWIRGAGRAPPDGVPEAMAGARRTVARGTCKACVLLSAAVLSTRLKKPL